MWRKMWRSIPGRAATRPAREEHSRDRELKAVESNQNGIVAQGKWKDEVLESELAIGIELINNLRASPDWDVSQ